MTIYNINPTIHNYRLIDAVHVRTIKERSQVRFYLHNYIYTYSRYTYFSMFQKSLRFNLKIHFGKILPTISLINECYR